MHANGLQPEGVDVGIIPNIVLTERKSLAEINKSIMKVRLEAELEEINFEMDRLGSRRSQIQNELSLSESAANIAPEESESKKREAVTDANVAPDETEGRVVKKQRKLA